MTTATTTTKRMTAEEFCDWVQLPENANKWFELVRGEVIELPSPRKIHGVVCVNVVTELNLYVRQRRKGYITSNDSGVILERDPDTVRGPDVALYEDASKFADLHPKYGEVPPRLAVEVLSPDDKAKHVTRKITDYLNNGVDLVWLIDPEDRTVTVYRRERGQYLRKVDEELTGDDILPDFRCKVADFFCLPEEMPQPG
ncbi:MAG TPA: Uma2 family endonuclease [Gemmataceae bacterium]|nr:Uma2 family endonuclease [Gemmataceae bacterium]